MHFFESESANFHHQDEVLCRWCQYKHFKTHWAPQIMHQNLGVILQQLSYSKISFIVLVPDCSWPARRSPPRCPILGWWSEICWTYLNPWSCNWGSGWPTFVGRAVTSNNKRHGFKYSHQLLFVVNSFEKIHW